MPEAPDKSLESWIWDAACSIRGAKEVGSRAKVFKLVKHDKKLVRFYLPLQPADPDAAVWSVIRKLADKIGEQLTTHLRAIADENPLLKGIIDRAVANPLWNQTEFTEKDYDADEFDRFPKGAGSGLDLPAFLAFFAVKRNI